MAKKLDPKKEQQEWLQGILLDMLKDEENKYCADCQAKTPRWAAWNLGVFICIRCAGIHRNLGVHISKVRSVNLDSWTPEQVQSMRVMGNEKARRVYEHDLPDHFRQPTTDHQMEQFIRSKYEQKRYMLKDFVYPRIDAKDLPRPNVLGQKKAPTAKFAHNASDHKPAHSPSSTAASASRSSGIADLLDLDAPAPASALPTTSEANHNSSSLIDDFDSLAIGGQAAAPPAAVVSAPSNDLDDMFGSFVSAPSSTPSVAAPIQSAPQSSNQSNGKSAAEKNDLFGLNLGEPTSTAASDGEKKSTADILSLFSTAQPAPPLIAPGGFTAFGLQAAAPSHPQPAQQASGQMNFANFGAANAGNAMTSSMPSLPASMSFGGFGLTAPAATPAMMSQSQSGGMIGLSSMGGLDLSAMGTGVQRSSNHPAQFPNPFGQPSMVPTNFAGQVPLSGASIIPTSPPAAYKIPNKSNAFADLSIGKVMNMNYMSGGKPKLETGGGSGMAAAQPQPQAIPATTAPSQQMNLDDLLGGF